MPSLLIWPFPAQAAEYFPQLGENNVFTGSRNVFRGAIEVRRCHVLSDPACKEGLGLLDPRESAELVRGIRPHLYRVDGRLAAGIMADSVPVEYTSPSDMMGGGVGAPTVLTVDYNSLLSHLWAAVRSVCRERPPTHWGSQDLQTRVEGLEKTHMPRLDRERRDVDDDDEDGHHHLNRGFLPGGGRGDLMALHCGGAGPRLRHLGAHAAHEGGGHVPAVGVPRGGVVPDAEAEASAPTQTGS